MDLEHEVPTHAKGKHRPIDDYSRGFVNSAFGNFEELDLGGLDEVVALAVTFLSAVSEDRQVKISLPSGKVLERTLHESVSVQQARDLTGRTLDLASAYRQLALSEAAAGPQSSRLTALDRHLLPFCATRITIRATSAMYSFNLCQSNLVFAGHSYAVPLYPVL